MLIQFLVSNFRSIANTQVFSMVASKLTDLPANLIELDEPNKINLLRTSVIYGANASGKSNFIRAMSVMATIVLDSASSYSASDTLPVKGFSLNPTYSSKPTEFEITLIINNVRYQFGFSCLNNKIKSEWLYSFPRGRSRTLYERTWNEEKNEYEWYMGGELKGEKNIWLKSTRPNALFLSTAVLLNSEQLLPIHNWFQENLQVSGISGWNHAFSASLCLSGNKQKVMNILKSADVGIDDVKVKKTKFDPSNLSDDMPDELKKYIISKMGEKSTLDVKIIHTNSEGDSIEFDFEDESDGTQKLFELAGPWIDSLEKGNILFIDELHNSLHPHLVKFLVSLFNCPKSNPKNAQLVFTTHETSILKQDVFRRDQIWFCEKNDSRETVLYPLTDFTTRKGFEDLESSYLSGKFGALPFINTDGW